MSCIVTKAVPRISLLRGKAFGVAAAAASCSRRLSSTVPQQGKNGRAVDPSVAGVWYNELGSRMVVFEKTDMEGQFTGTYHTKVGDATKQYPVVGRYDTDGDTTHGTMGFTVQWHNAFKNSYSVTTWSGQRQLDATGAPCILTTWLLTAETTEADDWESTNVGTDVFTRNEFELVARKHLHCSHPKDAHK